MKRIFTATPIPDGMPNPKYKNLYRDKDWNDWWKERMTQRRTLSKELADCFHECGRFMMYEVDEGEDVIMAHGKVTNPDGSVIEHAWVESGDRVVDLANNLTMKAEKYYENFKIDASEVKLYDRDETMINMVRSKHWGPWTNNGRESMKRIIAKDPYARRVTVWSDRSAGIEYDPATGYFKAYEEGWWGPDDFTIGGLYGLGADLGPIDEFADSIVAELKKYDIDISKEELLNAEPTYTDKYWVYLGNQGYGLLTGYHGMQSYWDEKEEEDEEGNYVVGYYEMDSSDVEAAIDKTLDNLASGKGQRELAEDAGNKQEYIYDFIETIEGEVPMTFVPYE